MKIDPVKAIEAYHKYEDKILRLHCSRCKKPMKYCQCDSRHPLGTYPIKTSGNNYNDIYESNYSLTKSDKN